MPIAISSWFWRRWRAPWFILGAIVFFGINGLLWLDGLPSIPNPPDPSATGAFIPIVLGTIAALLLLTAMGSRGRSTSAGFIVTLLVLSVATLGSCTWRWADPAMYLAQHVKRSRTESARAAGRSAAEARWRDSMRTSGLDLPWGVRRTSIIRMCIDLFQREDSSHRFPPDSAALPRGSGQCHQPDQYHRGPRSGWTTRYVPPDSAGHFALITQPESSLGLPGPVIELDERGLVVTRATTGDPAHVVVSPVDGLLELRHCVDSAVSLGRIAALQEVVGDPSGPCAPLRLRAYSGEARESTYPVAGVLDLPVGAKGWSTAAMYILEYAPRGGGRAGKFDFHARPRSFPGTAVRSYLLTSEGTLHVTPENRAATADDPAPLECETNLRIACWP